MQKIVLDTNILVSSLIQKNYSYFIINGLVIEKQVHLCVSDELMEEYYAGGTFCRMQRKFSNNW